MLQEVLMRFFEKITAEVERKERKLAGASPLQRVRRIYCVTTETEKSMLRDVGTTGIRSRCVIHWTVRSVNTSKTNSGSLHLSKKINALCTENNCISFGVTYIKWLIIHWFFLFLSNGEFYASHSCKHPCRSGRLESLALSQGGRLLRFIYFFEEGTKPIMSRMLGFRSVLNVILTVCY
jgi:hypothetical protein